MVGFSNKCLFKKLQNKSTLKKFVRVEKLVLKAVEAVTIAHALEIREYFYDLMRLRKLIVICGMLKMNYDPSSPTAYDDNTGFSQLGMNLVFLQAKIKFWEQDQKLFDLVEDPDSPEVSPIISPTVIASSIPQIYTSNGI